MIVTTEEGEGIRGPEGGSDRWEVKRGSRKRREMEGGQVLIPSQKTAA